MKKMCDLPTDMAEEVLCRIPLTSLRPVRSTCKKWNTLSRSGVFAKKHLAHLAEEAKEDTDTLVVMMMDYRVFLMRFNLSNKSCVVEREAKLIGPDGSDQIDVCEIFHCDGLLLCIPKDHSRLVVWNPYWGQTRWIEHTHDCHLVDKYTYALGYDNNSKSHKVLRFIDYLASFFEFKIYDFSSNSWRIIRDTLPRNDWMIIRYGERGLSLKGNTYWFASERQSSNNSFLVCFDFTRETFGPPLPLPFEAYFQDTVSLSSLREDQLVVLFQTWDILQFEIWISTKIGDDPNAVSWNSNFFLSANIKQLIHPQWQFPVSASFFIDEENKVAVVFDKDTDLDNPTREVAYIIGVDGFLKEAADVRECSYGLCDAFVCSYVPSLVQLN